MLVSLCLSGQQLMRTRGLPTAMSMNLKVDATLAEIEPHLTSWLQPHLSNQQSREVWFCRNPMPQVQHQVIGHTHYIWKHPLLMPSPTWKGRSFCHQPVKIFFLDDLSFENLSCFTHGNRSTLKSFRILFTSIVGCLNRSFCSLSIYDELSHPTYYTDEVSPERFSLPAALLVGW